MAGATLNLPSSGLTLSHGTFFLRTLGILGRYINMVSPEYPEYRVRLLRQSYSIHFSASGFGKSNHDISVPKDQLSGSRMVPQWLFHPHILLLLVASHLMLITFYIPISVPISSHTLLHQPSSNFETVEWGAPCRALHHHCHDKSRLGTGRWEIQRWWETIGYPLVN